MKTTLSSPPECPQCGRPQPVGALAGLCPACLLAQGAASGTGSAPGGSRFVPPPLEEVAALFPRLEIERFLGAGGMGAVYLARQPDLDRRVALKILPADGPGGTLFEERFNREARALARLNHPNIVAVHEFGRAGRHHYFLMEYVDGANLRQLEQAGRLSPREALQVVPQICDALQYAHDEGVVHRDIKPENILVDRRGRVKIADFGLARILGPDPGAGRITLDGQVMGTPHYMAPEQVERPLDVDHRADIYSLGVVFYEMLTGDLPLGKFAPPSRKVEVDVRLDAVVLRALENDPERRYQRAGDIKSGVETVVQTPADAAPGDASPEGAPGPVRKLRWAGVPVVVERDGEREVSFEGALGLLFLTMSIAAFGHYLVRWMTGGEHAVQRVVWMAGLMTAFWGLRRALLREEPRRGVARTADGTVILRRSRLPRFIRDYATLAALLAVVVGSHFIAVRVSAWRRGGAARESAGETPASRTFGEVLEREFDGVVDLDSGRVGTFPSSGGGGLFEGLAEDLAWMAGEGFDLSADRPTPSVLGVTWVPLDPAAWDNLSPAQVEERLAQGGVTRSRLESPDPRPDAVFAFRTREGAAGLLQGRWTDDRLRLRWKRIVDPSR